MWLQGGPGGSSLFGLFAEHGPFNVNEDHHLVPRAYAWTKTHNVIYIDNPAGTGWYILLMYIGVVVLITLNYFSAQFIAFNYCK